MAKTYTLSGTLHGGRRSGFTATMANCYAMPTAQVGGDGTYTYATNALFESSLLSALQAKTITSIKLTLTVTGTLYQDRGGDPYYDTYLIAYKLNDIDSTDSSGSAWTTSDNGSEAAVSRIAQITSGTDSTVYGTNTVTYDLTGSEVPNYGYVFRPAAMLHSQITITAATLVVETNETDYTLELSYLPNGGTGAPATQTYPVGSPVTLSATKPTRTGYEFLGWSESRTATTASYNAGGTYTFNGNKTLYAVWSRLTYTVSFNANGGTGAPTAQTKTYGVDLTLASGQPTREGYAFLGWSKSNVATETDYAPGDNFTENGNTTLYAVWKVVVEDHTLSYNANGGTGAPASETKTFSVLAPTVFTVSSAQPSRTGHQFKGWSSTAGGSVEYTAGNTIPASADKTLYAVWQINTYNVSFNANGGINPPSAQTKTYGVDLTLPTAQPTRDGYIFQGWAESADAAEIDYPAGGTYTKNQARTLYAVWQIRTYTVHFDAAGGSAAPADQTKAHGETLVLSPYIPRLKGYRFRGWGLAPNAQTIAYAPGDDYTANANVTLYALWRRSMYAGVYVVRNGRAIRSGVYV